MTKKLPHLIIGSLGLLLLVLFLHPLVWAGHPFGKEGNYCDNNEIWHDVPGIEPGKPYGHELRQQCTPDVCVPQPPSNPIYTQDAACLPPDSLPASGDGTKMYMIKSPVTQGEQLTIGISADKACYDVINVDLNAGPNGNSLKVFNQLLNCHVTEQDCGCETKHIRTTDSEGRTHCDNTESCNPGDWPKGKVNDCGEKTGVNPYDNKRCFKTIVCDTKSQGDNLNVPLVTNNTNCINNAKYQVVPGTSTQVRPALKCRKVSHPDQTQSKSDLVDISLVDDHENVTRWLNGTVPKEATAEAAKACLNKIVDAGIVKDAFGLQKFLCTNARDFLRNIPVIGSIFDRATICPKNTYVGGLDTDCLDKMSKVLAKSQTPEDVNETQIKDCDVVDYQKDNGQFSTGNAAISNISKYLGGSNGYMSHTTPEYPLELDRKINLNTEGHVLSGDDRDPDINARCNKDCIATHPAEVCLPSDSIECNNLTNANNPPIQSDVCRQTCFSRLDRCESENCSGKPEPERFKCANECVIEKDKCLKSCAGG